MFDTGLLVSDTIDVAASKIRLSYIAMVSLDSWVAVHVFSSLSCQRLASPVLTSGFDDLTWKGSTIDSLQPAQGGRIESINL